MEEYNFILENDQTLEYNDSIYDRVFVLEDFTNRIIIRPKVQFWRFGIRFSRTSKIEFFAPTGRYNDRNYPNIELVAGDIPSPQTTENSSHLHFSAYWMPGHANGQIFNTIDNYQPTDAIEIELSTSDKPNSLKVTWKTGIVSNTSSFELEDFRYFKLFGWADWHPYRIEGVIKKESIYVSPTNRYWFLKLDNQLVEITSLSLGQIVRIENTRPQTIEVQASASGKATVKRSDPVKSGDKLIGYDFRKKKAILCILEALFTTNNDQREDIADLKVLKVFEQSIPLTTFATKLSYSEKDLENIGSAVIRLPTNQYALILGLDSTHFPPGAGLYKKFESSYRTEGNHQQEDRLEFQPDVEAIASVIAQRNVQPPLAVGLFGNWGSGKSFFMKKLSDAISEYSNTESEQYVKHVVQVQFNSWHYSDTNLWASLTSQIFESLYDYVSDRKYGAAAVNFLYEQFRITGHQLDESREKLSATQLAVSALEREKADIEKTIQEKTDSLETWKIKDFVKIVYADPFVRSDFESIKSQFQTEQLIENITQVDEKLSEIATVGRQLSEAWSLLKNNQRGKWRWILGLGVIFGVLAWAALGPLKAYVSNFIKAEVIFTGLAATWFTNLLVKLRPYFKKIRQFRDRLKSLKDRIEAQKKLVKLQEHEEVETLRKDIMTLIREKDSLELEQKEIQDKGHKLEREIAEVGSGRLLGSFLAGKSSDEGYIKQLGLISSIRKDFAKLNELFENQKLVQYKEKDLITKMQVDRIVLYIDDLDRCNENVVIAVLEAIHLLLAFPLFVVVVGVDPRWLNNALDKKLGDLFGLMSDSTDGQKSRADQLATSYDYLEKIFQIPFAIKPITTESGKTLIAQLFEKEVSNGIEAQRGNSEVDAQSSVPLSSQVEHEGKSPQVGSFKLKVFEPENKEPLQISQLELSFIQRLSPIFSKTPRHVNRFVNIYRILKSHSEFIIYNPDNVYEYYRVLFLLAILVGQGELTAAFFKQIKTGNAGQTLQDLVSIPIAEKTDCNLASVVLAPIIRSTVDDNFLSTPLAHFLTNLELVSRFSFRTITL